MNIKQNVTEKTLQKLEKIIGGKVTLGKLIWSIRKGEEESQVNFAKTLEMSRQHLCDIEHDRKSVSPKLAAKYAEILGYSKGQFIRLSLQSIVDKENLNVTVKILMPQKIAFA